MIKTIIADDEQHAIDRLKDLLADHQQFDIIAIARSGSEALEQIVAHQPDLAFLDINMPGVSIFQTLASLSDPPLVVFQTAYSSYATDAFDINAVDYLLKPISRERFRQTVERVMERLSPGDNASSNASPENTMPASRIPVKHQEAIKLIPVSEVQKICFEEGLTFIYTVERRYISDHSLNHFEQHYESQGLFRASRASMINLAFIKTIHRGFKGGFYVELSDGSTVELSRRKAQLLRKILGF
mgnify:CR=1 FL=1